MKSILTYVVNKLSFASVLLVPLRFYNAAKTYTSLPWQILKWTFTSKEWTNYTYDLQDLNQEHLIYFISQITNTEIIKVREYIAELENDEKLKEYIRETTLKSDRSFLSDTEARYGRRLGWYAFTRIKKPKVIVETGVDKGLGSVVLAAALMKNASEGFEGHIYGTDINPKAGYLLEKEPYNSYGTIIYGDSIETLKSFPHKIDIIITDSNHDPNYELKEYETIKDRLNPGCLVISDTAHHSNKLIEFAETMNWNFLYFQEAPKGWFQGSGIGVAYKG
ncbi:MAG: class I SAM-dependent methyltransferase [Oscillatoria sp. SIO1A7]|nr:class I SAM-dependent methyltransferase [Oscillatoria sp. SIO1A7]